MSRVTKRTSTFAVAVVLSAVLAGVAVAGASSVRELQPLEPAPSADTGQMTNETGNLWFVEFPTAPLADGSRDADVDDDDDEFRREAQSEGANYKERLRFRTLWNGMSVEAKPGAIAKIRKLASVKAVFPVGIQAIPPRGTVSPDLATALQMTGADIAQSELGFTGKGIRVAVMDTGIDYHHPDLGGGFGPGTRVVTGFDFVGDAFVGDNTPVPDPDPDDCNGHGTHVAGIVGANGGVTGVAPGVTFGAYRVFGCDGFTTDDIMIAAMERALRDNMDVLNMSIGDAFNNWPGTPTAAASNRLVRKGMVVVASIGNSGANGLYAAGAPGVGKRVIGVASYDNISIQLPLFRISPDNAGIGYDRSDSPIPPTSGTFPMALTSPGPPAASPPADACTALPAGSLTGKVALVRRGSCFFSVKATNAQAAGAAGVVIYNNVPGRIGGITVATTPPITIPVVSISGTDGDLIRGRLGAGPVDLTWTNEVGTFPNTTTGELISSFSSYGLAADLSLKPDIGAPGGFIRSTVPLEQGGYDTISGTSMSSPHVAGAAALLLESWAGGRRDGDEDDDDNRADDVRDVLQNSADPALWSLAPGFGLLDHPHRQGAGMLDIDDAILATTLVTPGKLSLGESEAGPATRTLRIKNNGDTDVTYDLSFEAAVSTGPTPTTTPPFTFGFFLADDQVTFSSPSVTVRRGGAERVRVTIAPDPDPGLPNQTIYGGYIVLTPQGGGAPLRVPYSGFKGDYQSIQILTPGPFGLPLLLDGNFDDHPAPFTLANAVEQPNVLFHMNHQARRLELTVVRASNGRTLGRVVELEFLPRNATSGGFFVLAWDGTFQGENGRRVRTAPDGQYTLVLTVEKPLAERRNPAHFESWTSPVFEIDRP